MTVYERMMTDKEWLVKSIVEDEWLYRKAEDWCCLNRCPNRINGVCKHHETYGECRDDTDSKEIVRMWLDSEATD